MDKEETSIPMRLYIGAIIDLPLLMFNLILSGRELLLDSCGPLKVGSLFKNAFQACWSLLTIAKFMTSSFKSIFIGFICYISIHHSRDTIYFFFVSLFQQFSITICIFPGHAVTHSEGHKLFVEYQHSFFC